MMGAQLRLIPDTGSLTRAPSSQQVNLDLLADQRAQLAALAAFYRAHKGGLPSDQAMRLALEAARSSALERSRSA